MAGLNGIADAFENIQLSASLMKVKSCWFLTVIHFFNLVVIAQTDVIIERVCEILKKIEDEKWSIRGAKSCTRTLDLDY